MATGNRHTVNRPQPKNRGWFNVRGFFQWTLTLGGALLLAVIVLLTLGFVQGQYSQAGVIGHLAQRVGIRSPADLETRRLEVRTFMIRSQLEQAKSPIVIIGDSITEAALLPSSMCGHDVVNAGVGGMTIGSYLPLAKQLLAGRWVSSIIVALGTNDSGTSTAHINEDYIELVDELAKHTPNILLAGLPPLEMSGELAGRYFDPASADRNNAAIRALATTRHLPFIDLRSAMHGGGLTVDGVHLTAAGYDQWREVVRGNMYSALGCVEQNAFGER